MRLGNRLPPCASSLPPPTVKERRVADWTQSMLCTNPSPTIIVSVDASWGHTSTVNLIFFLILFSTCLISQGTASVWVYPKSLSENRICFTLSFDCFPFSPGDLLKGNISGNGLFPQWIRVFQRILEIFCFANNESSWFACPYLLIRPTSFS